MFILKRPECYAANCCVCYAYRLRLTPHSICSNSPYSIQDVWFVFCVFSST